MWYAGNDGTNYRVYYATSPDGLTWTKYDNTVPSASDTTSTNGRIPLGTAGKGDSAHVSNPSVIKDRSTYKMWYVGNDGTNSRIFYATSPDGLTWTKYDNTVPSASDTTSTNGRIPIGNAGRADSSQATNPFVIKDGPIYKMWYTGNDGTNYRILYATSPDGLTWTKYDNTVPSASDTTSTNGRIPLGTAGKGDSSRALEAFVIKDGSVYKIWYTGYDGTNNRVYYAEMSQLPIYQRSDNVTKIEGSGSEKITIGAPQVDVNTVALWHFEETTGTGAYIKDSVPGGFNPDTNKNLTTNLVSYWKMDESSGNIADSKGSNTGTPTGTSVVAGKLSNGRSFDGASYISMGTGSSLAFGTGSFSFGGWIKTSDSGNYKTIISKTASNGGATVRYYNRIEASTGSFHASIADGTNEANINCGSGFADGNWHYVMTVVNRTSQLMINYVDGISRCNTTISSIGNVNSAQDFRVGILGTQGYYFIGTIDELGVWSKDLSPQEISDLYNSGYGNIYLGGGNDGTPTGTSVVDGFYGKARNISSGNY